MARLLVWGAELQGIQETFANTGTPTYSTAITHTTGGASARFNGFTSGTARKLSWSFQAAAAAHNIFAFWLYVTTFPSARNRIIDFNDGTSRWSVDLGSDQKLYLKVVTTDLGSPSVALSAGVWNLIEVDFDNTPSGANDIITLKLNGTSVATSSTQNVGTSSTIAIGANLAAEAQTVGDWYFDDLAINNTAGSFENSLIGTEMLVALRPNAAGDNNAWTGTFASVNETPIDDTTTKQTSNTLNQTCDHNMGASPATIGSATIINCVAVGVRHSGAGASANASYVLRIEASSGGTVEESAAFAPTNANWVLNGASGGAGASAYRLVLYDLPGSSTAAWTKADLDAMQCGYRLSTASTNAVQISGLWAYVAFTQVNSTLTADVGTFTETGNAATLTKSVSLRNLSITADVTAFTEIGNAATLKAARITTAATGTFTETGVVAGLNRGLKITATATTFAETGNAAALLRKKTVSATTASFAEVGNVATLKIDRRLTASTGTFAETPVSATLALGLPASVGSFAISSVGATLKATRVLTAATGSFVEVGNAATLLKLKGVLANTVAFAVTPVSATLKVTRLLGAVKGTFIETGNIATLNKGRMLSATVQAFAVTGISASLNTGRKVAASAGSFTESGIAATLNYGRLVSAATGVFIETGRSATLNKGRSLNASTGVYALVGNSAGKFYNRVFAAQTGLYLCGTVPAMLAKDWRASAGAGAFTFSGNDIAEIHNWNMLADLGAYDLTGLPAELLHFRIGAFLAATGTFLVTPMQAILRTGITPSSDIILGRKSSVEGNIRAASAGSFENKSSVEGNSRNSTSKSRSALARSQPRGDPAR